MPRGVRRINNIDEQLKSLDEKISSLQAERRNLLQQKQEMDLRALTNFMAQNKLSASDIIAAVTNGATMQENAVVGESA